MTAWRVAAWTHPATPAGFTVIDHSLPLLDADLVDTAEPRGRGTITLPASYPWRDLINADQATPANNRSTLLRVYRDGVDDTGEPDLEYVVERYQRRIMDDGAEGVQLTLKDWRTAGLDAARVRWWDWTAGATRTSIPDWIYGGRNLIPLTTIGDLGSIKATWRLWLERERYTLDIDATGGTFTLEVNGEGPTAAIDWDASASTIRSELEALTGINEVHVETSETGRHTIVFNDPTVVSPDLTWNTGSLTGGTGTLTKVAEGFDFSSDPTFTITVVNDAGSDTTDAINWNDSPGEIANHLELDLANVEDVTVTGSGTYEDPWVVVFYQPTEVSSVSITFAGAESAVEDVEGVPDPAPFEVSQRFDNRIEPDLHGTYTDPPVEVVTDPLYPGTTWSMQVNPDGEHRFAGGQVRLSVAGGWTYQAGVPVRASVAGEYRITVRDAYENPILFDNVDLAADTWTVLTLANIEIPTGTDQVVLRIGQVGTSPTEWETFWIAWEAAYFTEGMPRATIGKQANELLADAQTDHAPDLVRIPWVQAGAYTDTLDDNGDAWVREESLTIRRGQWYGTHVAGELWGGLGYEYDLTPNGATPLWDWELYNPGGRGTDHTDPGPSHLALYVGVGVAGGLVAGRMPKATRIMVEGADGLIGEAANTAQEDIFGVIEDFLGEPDLTDTDTINARAAEQLGEDLANTIAVQVELDDTLTAYEHINIGDTLPVDAPGYFTRHNRRISEIGLRLTVAEGEGTWTQTVVASKIYTGEAARNEAIYRYLIGQERLPEKEPSAVIATTSGPGRAPTLVLAAGSSTQESKDRADYILDGSDAYNRSLLEAAIARVAERDGRLLFTEGTFSFGEEYSIIIPSGATLLFEGAGVSLSGTAVTSLQWDFPAETWLQVDGTLLLEKIELRQTPGG